MTRAELEAMAEAFVEKRAYSDERINGEISLAFKQGFLAGRDAAAECLASNYSGEYREIKALGEEE